LIPTTAPTRHKKQQVTRSPALFSRDILAPLLFGTSDRCGFLFLNRFSGFTTPPGCRPAEEVFTTPDRPADIVSGSASLLDSLASVRPSCAEESSARAEEDSPFFRQIKSNLYRFSLKNCSCHAGGARI
jgi:hypothetical protein